MSNRKTPLYDSHEARGARFTEFGGWEMPVTFDSIKVEHAAVRGSVGVFDVSHMGELSVAGPDSRTLCQRLTSNDVDRLTPGAAQYSTVTDESGIILDDIMLFQRDAEDYLFVPNAGTDEWMTDHWVSHRDEWGLDATVENQTTEYAMLAIQGPDAIEVVGAIGEDVPTDLDRNHHAVGTVAGVECRVSHTGYTGEAGVELLIPWDQATIVDEALEAQRCGLGARDTLRLEMGYLLGGHEFDRESNPRTPLEAGVDFVVSLDAEPPFLGHDRLVEQAANGPEQRLVGFELTERGIPRQGYDILDEAGSVIGEVTSGTMSPTLGEPIGMGYVDSSAAQEGREIGVSIRGAAKKARIVIPPFLESTR